MNKIPDYIFLPNFRSNVEYNFRLRRSLQLLGASSFISLWYRFSDLGILATLCYTVRSCIQICGIVMVQSARLYYCDGGIAVSFLIQIFAVQSLTEVTNFS